MISIQIQHTVYRVGQKMAQFLYTSQFHQILTDSQNSFTVKIRRQFVIKLSLQIPPHLKCVVTLPRDCLLYTSDAADE